MLSRVQFHFYKYDYTNGSKAPIQITTHKDGTNRTSEATAILPIVVPNSQNTEAVFKRTMGPFLGPNTFAMVKLIFGLQKLICHQWYSLASRHLCNHLSIETERWLGAEATGRKESRQMDEARPRGA